MIAWHWDRLGFFAVCCVLAGMRTSAAQAAVDYATQVRPLLERHCLACHGERQKGGLRLDVRSSVLRGGESSRPAVVPGQPDASQVLERVRSTDENQRMPLMGESLGPEEIELLAQWIAEGANWPDDLAGETAQHWSFVRPQRPSLPAVRDAAWPRNPIDRFILARLEEEGLSPSAEADRATLIRRLSLDLIGLPPTPEETAAFVADERPDAYAALVERLLASPHFGERWARPWLDLAHYSDTNGYEKDRTRSIWPYRDWVVAALNADLPFDQFTLEQLAGDLLPDATLAQRTATGFLRNTLVNEEGGIDVEEFRYYAVVDRVATIGQTWLGLTLNCAQCHSHKYDPLTQREYWQLFAFLNNCDEPELPLPTPEITAQREAISQQIAALEAGLQDAYVQAVAAAEASPDERATLLAQRQAAWEESVKPTAHPWHVVQPTLLQSDLGATFTPLADGSVLVSGDNPNRNTYTISFPLPLERVTGIRLEVLPDESLPGGGPGRAPLFSVGDFLLSEIEAALTPADGGPPQSLALANPTHDFAQDGRSAALALDGDLDTGWSIQGRTGEPHRAVFPLAEPLSAQGRTLTLTLQQIYIHQMTIGRFRLAVTSDEGPLAACSEPAAVETALLVPMSERTAEQQQILRRAFLLAAPELAAQREQLAALRKSLPAYPTTLVLAERAAQDRRQTCRHHRGEFLSPREEVTPDVPAALHAWSDEWPRDRAGLARWLTAAENPLVGRVVMNRYWMLVFGAGLVRTPEDFGTRGARPIHRELLDWLAVEFVERGYSLKHMVRLLVTSATYRQASRVSPELLARDPENLLLARLPRLRLEAELVRDAALAASGLLDPRLGGPPVFPPQPEGVNSLSYGGFSWTTSAGGDRYRRGLYTFLKRTSPYAMFGLFDAPSGEVSCPRRVRSNTPLQSLTLLNDTVFVEAARALAQRAVAKDGPDDAQRCAYLFQCVLARAPDVDESAAMREFLAAQRARLSGGELDAAAILGGAGDPPPSPAEQAERAAWTLLARAVLNLDEAITRE